MDGKTNDFHTEKDCAYTGITVPKQVLQGDIPSCDQPKFIVKID